MVASPAPSPEVRRPWARLQLSARAERLQDTQGDMRVATVEQVRMWREQQQLPPGQPCGWCAYPSPQLCRNPLCRHPVCSGCYGEFSGCRQEAMQQNRLFQPAGENLMPTPFAAQFISPMQKVRALQRMPYARIQQADRRARMCDGCLRFAYFHQRTQQLWASGLPMLPPCSWCGAPTVHQCLNQDCPGRVCHRCFAREGGMGFQTCRMCME